MVVPVVFLRRFPLGLDGEQVPLDDNVDLFRIHARQIRLDDEGIPVNVALYWETKRVHPATPRYNLLLPIAKKTVKDFIHLAP
jgi:hypothetical protein